MADESKINQVTADMDDLSFDPTMKKKKSSARKKSVSFEDPSAEGSPEASAAGQPGKLPYRPLPLHSSAILTN